MSKLTPFKYAIVQFHRNPLRGEPFNLGLLLVSAHDPAFVKFEMNIKSALKLEEVEHQTIQACLSQMGEAVHKAAGNLSFLEEFAGSYTGKIQLTEVRGGLSSDISVESEKLFQTFVEHPRLRAARVATKSIAKDLNAVFREHKLMGKKKVHRNYIIDQVKTDFGYAFGTGHVAIETVDLTLPTREERLEEVGPAAGKFQFLGDTFGREVKRFAAVKRNGVDASWELHHLKDTSDRVFDIEKETLQLVGEIETHLYAT